MTTLTVRDEQAAEAMRAALGGWIAVRTPDGRLLGRFTPASRPGMTMPELDMTDEELERLENNPNAVWVPGDEVVAILRQLSTLPPGIRYVFPHDRRPNRLTRRIEIGNPALALILAESDDDGIPLYDPNGNLLGRFVPEPRPGRDDPHVVTDDPDANDEG